MTIHRRLLLNALIPLAIITCLGLVIWRGCLAIGAQARRVQDHALPGVIAAAAMRNAIHEIRFHTLLVATASSSEPAQEQRHLQECITALTQKLMPDYSRDLPPDGREIIDRLDGVLRRMLASSARCLSHPMDSRAAIEEFNQISDQALTLATELVDFSRREISSAQHEVVGQAAHLTRTNIVMTIGALALTLLLAFILARRVARELRTISDRMGVTTNQVAAASQEIASSSQGLAQGASEQAASLEEAAASLESITASTRHNADNARAADALSKDANQAAVTGEQGARQVASEVGRRLTELGAAVAAIKKATDETARVVSTIDEIAFQTNLLALNAAVEAARAGEAGAGFAVVADEVRSLAQRCAEEVKNTGSLMEQAQEATSRVMASSDQVGAYLGKALNDEVVSAFQRLVVASAKVTALMAEVRAASEEQANGLSQVTSAVSDMDRVTQTNASTAEECAAASEELSAQSVNMREQAGQLAQLVGGVPTIPAQGTPDAPPPGRPAAPVVRTPVQGKQPAVKPAAATGAIPANARLLPLTDDEVNAQGDFSRF